MGKSQVLTQLFYSMDQCSCCGNSFWANKDIRVLYKEAVYENVLIFYFVYDEFSITSEEKVQVQAIEKVA